MMCPYVNDAVILRPQLKKIVKVKYYHLRNFIKDRESGMIMGMKFTRNSPAVKQLAQ